MGTLPIHQFADLLGPEQSEVLWNMLELLRVDAQLLLWLKMHSHTAWLMISAGIRHRGWEAGPSIIRSALR